jgi:hypothetical protein
VPRRKISKQPTLLLLSSLLLTWILVLSVCFAPETVSAQERSQARVAVLNPFASPEPGYDAFRAALLELGYIEGKNLVIEVRETPNNVGVGDSLVAKA